MEKAIWTSTIGSQKGGMIWNTFDLVSGSWKQEFFGGGVQLWSDTWDTSGTPWNYRKPILTDASARELPEQNTAVESASNAGFVLISSALCLCLVGIAYI